MAHEHTYSAYGLGLCSDLEIPELRTTQTGPHVRIRLGKVAEPVSGATSHPWYLWAAPGKAYLFSREIGAFWITDGKEVLVEPAPECDKARLRQSIVCGVMGLLLFQRGNVVLHGSAVGIGGRAVAFLGHKGSGKSVMAAALLDGGHEFISDDLVAVDLSGEKPMVMPGVPQLRLWPDSLAALGDDPAALPRILEDTEKRAKRFDERFASAALPLARLYVLDEGHESRIEVFGRKEAMFQLIPHLYNNRFGIDFLRDMGAASHFQQCAELVGRTKVCRLTRPFLLEALPEIAALVEEDLLHNG